MKSSIKSAKARIERSLRRYIIFALLRERTEFLRHELVSNRWRMNQDAYIRFRKPTPGEFLVRLIFPFPHLKLRRKFPCLPCTLSTLCASRKTKRYIAKVSIVLRQKYFCDTDRIVATVVLI